MGSTKKIDFSKIQEEKDFIGYDPVDVSRLKEVVHDNILEICQRFIFELADDITKDSLKWHIDNFLQKISEEQKIGFFVEFVNEAPLDWLEELFGRRKIGLFDFEVTIFPKDSEKFTMHFYFEKEHRS
jgi:hypothetical protein